MEEILDYMVRNAEPASGSRQQVPSEAPFFSFGETTECTLLIAPTQAD